MRDVLELPRLSLEERDRRWTRTRAAMEARGPRLPRAVGLAASVGFLHRQCPLSVPDRRQRRVQRAGIPADGEPTSFVLMPTFLEGWPRARIGSPTCVPGAAHWADTVADRLERAGAHGAGSAWTDWPARSIPTAGCRTASICGSTNCCRRPSSINLDDMMEMLRTVKSDEEIAILVTGRATRRPDAGNLP